MEKEEKYLKAKRVEWQLANLKQLTFEIIDTCNLRCKYGGYGEFYDNYDKRESKMISVDAALKLIDYLAALWNSEQNSSAKRNVYMSFYGGQHFYELLKMWSRCGENTLPILSKKSILMQYCTIEIQWKKFIGHGRYGAYSKWRYAAHCRIAVALFARH
jgi:hypothetical protein